MKNLHKFDSELAARTFPFSSASILLATSLVGGKDTITSCSKEWPGSIPWNENIWIWHSSSMAGKLVSCRVWEAYKQKTLYYVWSCFLQLCIYKRNDCWLPKSHCWLFHKFAYSRCNVRKQKTLSFIALNSFSDHEPCADTVHRITAK